MRKDLKYAIDREWFGAPKDCVPKSALEQILDASKPRQYGVVCRKDKEGELRICDDISDIKKLLDEGYKIHMILDKQDLKTIAQRLC